VEAVSVGVAEAASDANRQCLTQLLDWLTHHGGGTIDAKRD